jgi:hypothetical protein
MIDTRRAQAWETNTWPVSADRGSTLPRVAGSALSRRSTVDGAHADDWCSPLAVAAARRTWVVRAVTMMMTTTVIAPTMRPAERCMCNHVWMSAGSPTSAQRDRKPRPTLGSGRHPGQRDRGEQGHPCDERRWARPGGRRRPSSVTGARTRTGIGCIASLRSSLSM